MISIIAGTNRHDSKTLLVAKFYQQILAQKNVDAHLISLCDLPDNMLKSDLYGRRSEQFQLIQDKVSATTKFIFVIPEYNGSFPGVLKLFIDGCKFPESFSGKKAALVGIADGTYGNIRGVEHFTGICNYIGITVLPTRIHIPKINSVLDTQGAIIDPTTLKFVNDQIDKLLVF
ncbi:NAD(P)H-dependent oxidoreductase [Solitalea sp. MAHUQ-68]|uniref:NAD(P)H-dependent oxidoreductase n=1 Tax=Solitalea agri TaxID=2953739 RepID=A0A9X2F1P4_9SPHI|nr:NAD(P)H-dependent oxidoreductase [Solitalea agri]MCO4292581.1 NAD(P)H-dependent oxidoreductase [Solitalea agri]